MLGGYLVMKMLPVIVRRRVEWCAEDCANLQLLESAHRRNYEGTLGVSGAESTGRGVEAHYRI